jgi:flagellar basal-body rod protein FlgF
MYTRNGSFKLSGSGLLITADGYPVRGDGGKEIQSTSPASIDISPNGTLQQAGQTLGQLEIVDFANPNTLNKVGGSYFKPTDAKEKPIPAVGATVEQGRIEASNVVAAESAVRLVELMRQYEMLQKAVTVASEMDKKATDQVAGVNS